MLDICLGQSNLLPCSTAHATTSKRKTVQSVPLQVVQDTSEREVCTDFARGTLVSICCPGGIVLNLGSTSTVVSTLNFKMTIEIVHCVAHVNLYRGLARKKQILRNMVVACVRTAHPTSGVNYYTNPKNVLVQVFV